LYSSVDGDEPSFLKQEESAAIKKTKKSSDTMERRITSIFT